MLPERKNIRLAPVNYRGYGFYFVTLCCHQRQKIFVDPGLCQWLLDHLRAKAVVNSFKVPAYCLMPDHCHFLFEALEAGCDLLRFVKSFKIKTSRVFKEQEGRILWQHGYFEHILRCSQEIQSVAWYIWLNPVRKGLVAAPQDYLYAGSFTGQKMPPAWQDLSWKPEWKR